MESPPWFSKGEMSTNQIPILVIRDVGLVTLRLTQRGMMMTRCPRCQSEVSLVFVHGHYQCPMCKSNVDDCCQGEVCQVPEPTKKYRNWLEEKGLPHRRWGKVIKEGKK